MQMLDSQGTLLFFLTKNGILLKNFALYIVIALNITLLAAYSSLCHIFDGEDPNIYCFNEESDALHIALDGKY